MLCNSFEALRYIIGKLRICGREHNFSVYPIGRLDSLEYIFKTTATTTIRRIPYWTQYMSYQTDRGGNTPEIYITNTEILHCGVEWTVYITSNVSTKMYIFLILCRSMRCVTPPKVALRHQLVSISLRKMWDIGHLTGFKPPCQNCIKSCQKCIKVGCQKCIKSYQKCIKARIV